MKPSTQIIRTRQDAELFRKQYGFYPISGGDGAGDPPPAGAPPAGAPPAGAPPAGAPPAGAPPAGAPPAAPEFATLIPAEYKDEPFVKETKDLPSLFKRTKDLLAELGKRPAGIPQKNAKPEEVAAFRKAFGVPEKPEEYVFGETPKELGPANPKFQTAVKTIFHKHGVSSEQASGIEKDWNALQLEMAKEAGTLADAQDTDFIKLKTETFGNRAEEAIKGSRLLIAQFAPAKFKPLLATMTNENLILMAGVIDGIRKEYITEDRMPKEGNAAPVGADEETRKKRRMELMGSPAYADPFHVDHDKTVAEVNSLYKKK